MGEEKYQRFSWLDVFKGIGIVLVLVGHVYSDRIIFNWLYSFHMPLFFLAAGYIYKVKPIFADVKRRFRSIVMPYFSFGILVLIYWQLIERRFRESDVGFMDSFLGLLSGEYRYLDFNVHLWFLPCFFVTVVLFNALVNAGTRCIKQKHTYNRQNNRGGVRRIGLSSFVNNEPCVHCCRADGYSFTRLTVGI